MTRRYGLDATPLLGKRTGIGRVVAELVARIVPRLADDEELVLCARVFRQNPLSGVSHGPLHEAARHARVRVVRQWLPYVAAERIGRLLPGVPLDLGAGPLDVFHGTSFFLPATRRARLVVTIHDLDFLRHPEHQPAAFRRRYERVTRDAAARARRVIADSDATGRDVAELLGVPTSRIETVHLGVGDAFRAPGDPERDRAHLVQRYGIAFPTVLFVGTTNPRKNLGRLLAAFAEARRRAPLPHRLVLAGGAGFGDDAIRAEAARLGLGDAVALPGFVEDADVPALYRTADALAFPSLYEGFGLPVVEAFAAGCPVLTSTAPCLPEIAGDAALLVDPTSVDAIADGLVRLLTDPPLRERLVAAGRDRARRFTWDAAAERHLAIYREVAAAHG